LLYPNFAQRYSKPKYVLVCSYSFQFFWTKCKRFLKIVIVSENCWGKNNDGPCLPSKIDLFSSRVAISPDQSFFAYGKLFIINIYKRNE
jgi:hypothetical protein